MVSTLQPRKLRSLWDKNGHVPTMDQRQVTCHPTQLLPATPSLNQLEKLSTFILRTLRRPLIAQMLASFKQEDDETQVTVPNQQSFL